ncbi:MAG: 16S rRNA (cytidine(1402)-2'-O)-methyltransferase [Moraxella sp.]|nr:16S rRNA (cytidine(1402)-2'-O)-methyltransferase [Moraxella sp.]
MSGRSEFGVLYVVATPIGNLADMTARAIDCLKTVDIIACEDTRTSAKLLSYFNISTKTWAYHDHNADTQTAQLLDRLKAGQSIALISDAGTPLVSDPGYRLVKACHEANVSVSPIVGASAAIGALSVAGLPSDKFYFYGFLPVKSTARKAELYALKRMTATLIFYEAPHRILDCLADMAQTFGADRRVTFCRELTKTFETVRLTTLGELCEFVKADSNQQKGEIVIVVAGDTEKTDEDLSVHDPLLTALMAELPIKKAAALASTLTGVKKNTLYDRLLILKEKTDT